MLYDAETTSYCHIATSSIMDLDIAEYNSNINGN